MNIKPFFIKAVLFDFDGTLTKPGAIDFLAVKQAVNCPEEVPVLEYIESMSDQDRKARALDVLEAFETDAARHSQPNFYAEELISLLCSKKIRTGIISRNSLQSIRIALENFSSIGISDFDVIISRDDPVQPKPSAESVILAAKKINIALEQVVVVGDYIFDMEAGRNAGAVTIFLSNGDVSDKAELNSDALTSSIQTKLMPFGYKAELNSEALTSSIQTKLMPFGYKAELNSDALTSSIQMKLMPLGCKLLVESDYVISGLDEVMEIVRPL